MKFKKWIPGIMLGTMMTAMTAVPVLADNINSSSTPPRIDFSRVSSTNVESISGDVSGKVYDFKDSKTSGAVVVTKTWDDSMSNDERSVPDISISTAKPSKNPMGYTIIYHENGLTFSDGSTENEMLVSSSGKILSGSYKIPDGLFAGWYSDKACTKRVEVDSYGLPVDGLASDMELYAKTMTFVLKKGSDFNKLIPSTATSVVFSDEIMPSSAELIDVDADSDKGIVAWMDGTTMVVSTQMPNQKIIASADCSSMFYSKSKLVSINFNNLDTSNVTDMRGMFRGDKGLTDLNVSPLDTNKLQKAAGMFKECSSLTSLDLSMLNFQNVYQVSDYIRSSYYDSYSCSYGSMFEDCQSLTSLKLPKLSSKIEDLAFMFSDCYKLTNLDLTPLDTSNVTTMAGMFEYCTKLLDLDVSSMDTSRVTDGRAMFKGCSSLTSLDLSMLNFKNLSKVSDWKKDGNSYSQSTGAMFEMCSSLKTLKLPELTNKITNLAYMFDYCSKLSSVDFSQFDTSNVTDMHAMFSSCYSLKILYLGDKFSFIGSDYLLAAGTWYSSNGTAYTSNGKSCTIPNNKADTYTRR